MKGPAVLYDQVNLEVLYYNHTSCVLTVATYNDPYMDILTPVHYL